MNELQLRKYIRNIITEIMTPEQKIKAIENIKNSEAYKNFKTSAEKIAYINGLLDDKKK